MPSHIAIRRHRAIVLAVAVAVSLVSFVIHSPSLSPPVPWSFRYSDIVSLYHSIFVAPSTAELSTIVVEVNGTAVEVSFGDPVGERWFSRETLDDFVSGRRCPLPYVDYKLEYPPVVGSIWVASVCVPYLLSKSLAEWRGIASVVEMVDYHYVVQGVAVVVSFLASAVLLARLSELVGASWRRALFFLLLPSTTLYLVYNYDAVSLAFMLASVYSFVVGRAFWSGLALGLAVSSKVLPATAGIPMLALLVQSRRREGVAKFVLGGLLGITPYIALLALAPAGLLWSIDYVREWFCENCIYGLFTGDIYSPINKFAASTLIGVATCVATVVALRRRSAVDSVALCILGTVTFNYIFTPQMMLLLTPLTVLVLPVHLLPVLAVADIFNFLIVPMIGVVEEATAFMRSLGLQAVPYPFHPASPVQLVANVRNTLLLALFVRYGIRTSWSNNQ